ncbi:MAG: hypothetical protein ABF381_12020 [Akkermansiaceae bacterium]
MKILIYSLILAFSADGPSDAAPTSDKLPLIFKYRCSEELRLTAIKTAAGPPSQKRPF